MRAMEWMIVRKSAMLAVLSAALLVALTACAAAQPGTPTPTAPGY